MAKTNNSSVPAFGMKDRIGYMFGDFGKRFHIYFIFNIYVEILHRRYGNVSSCCWVGNDDCAFCRCIY